MADRAIPFTIANMIAGLPTESLSLARCVKLVLRDGTELGFTDHDTDLVIALDSDFYDPVTYQAGEGLIVGDIDLALGLNADSTELGIPFGTNILLRHQVGRRLNHADVYVFDVDWTLDEPVAFEWMKGQVADARAEGPVVKLEVRSQSDYWNVTVGELMTPRCPYDFGDIDCTKTKIEIPTTILAVESDQRFTVDLAGLYTDNYFRFGELKFTSGGLLGVWSEEVWQYDGTTGIVELFTSLPDAPEVGDALWVAQGCSRLKSTGDPTVPTCFTHENVVNFGGYDRMPGSDVYLRMPIPGKGGA